MSLPSFLKPLFWDVEFEELSLDKYKDFITKRILNLGDMDSVRWLINQVDKNYIKQVVTAGRDINPKTKNYWQVVL